MSSPETWRAWQGRVIAGRFPLSQWLGSSDHSAVFLTQRPGQPSQKAAIKLIAADPATAERQLSCWRAAAQLSHPNLIRIFEADRCQMDGAPLLYVLMEYAEEDLSQILPQRPLTPGEVADLLLPLLDALSYLHEKKLTHGRIKPSNILAAGDELKLSADQVSPWAEVDARQRPRDVYDAPETAAGIHSPASDIWSLGVTLVIALTQGMPSVGGTQAPTTPENIPEPFRGIVRECLHFDPQRRCTIAQVQARLQPPARSVPAPVTAPPPPPRRSLRKGVVATAMAVAALLIALLVFRSREKNVPAETEQTAAASAPATPAREPAKPGKNSALQGAVLHQVIPGIPQGAMNTITGTIKISVRVAVDPSGKVTAAQLVHTGPSKYFANFALKAAQRWEFSPPQVDGQPAPSSWLILFRLRRSGIQASADKAR